MIIILIVISNDNDNSNYNNNKGFHVLCFLSLRYDGLTPYDNLVVGSISQLEVSVNRPSKR